jgi:hypothetical protein
VFRSRILPIQGSRLTWRPARHDNSTCKIAGNHTRSKAPHISSEDRQRHLRPRRRFANHGAGHEGSPDGASKSMAESICRATDRLGSNRVPEPLRHPECPTSKEDAGCVSSVLPRIEASLGLGKQCPFPRQVLSVGKVIAILQLGDFTTVMNALLRRAFEPDVFLANYRRPACRVLDRGHRQAAITRTRLDG